MSDYSLAGLICLHLNRISDIEDGGATYESSTPGIAEKMEMGAETMAGRVDLLSTLSEMSEKDLVEQKTARVEGLGEERNVYSLTGEGEKRAREVLDRLESEEITVRTSEGETSVRLDNIGDYLEEGVEDPLITALARADGDLLVLEDEYKTTTEKGMFVNRSEEFEELRSRFEQALEGEPQTVFVSGEPGVGKTTLVRRLEDTVTNNGGRFLYGRCDSDVAEPYQAFVAAFEDLDDEDNDLSTLLTDKSEVEADDRDKLNAQRRGLFNEVSKKLEKVSESIPVVLFVDDLQWIDEPTALLLAALSRKVEKGRFLLVGASRPETSTGDWPLAKVLEELDEDGYEWLEINRLSREWTAELIREVVGNLNVPDEVIGMLYEQTDGNPLFVTESVNHMLDKRDIDPKLGIYPESPDEISIPDEVEDTVASRLEVLDEDAESVLELGSVIGDTVPQDILKETSELEEADFLDYVTLLVDSGVWRYGEKEETLYFGSSVVRTTIRDTIDDEKLRELHGKIANTYRELRDETEDAATIAYHERKAGNREEALDYYQEAGEHAKEVYAHETAIDAYKEATELARELDREETMMEVVEDLGEIYHILDEYDKAVNHYGFVREHTENTERKQRIYRKEASVHDTVGEYDELFEKVDKGLELANESEASRVETTRLHSLRGHGMTIQGDPDGGLERYRRALELVEELDDSNEEKTDVRAHILNGMGNAYRSKGEIGRATEIFEDLVDIRRDTDDKQDLGSVLLNYGAVLGRGQKYERSVEVYEESLEIFEEIGDREGIMSVLNNLGITYQYLDENEKAIECFEDGVEIARATENKRSLALLYVNLGYANVNLGKFKDAIEYARDARELGEEIGQPTTVVCTYEIEAVEQLHQGELEKGLETAKEGLEIAREAEAKNRIAGTLSIIGELHIERDELEAAIEAFEEGIEESLEYGNKQKANVNRAGLVRALVKSGETEKAEKYIDELEKVDGMVEEIVPALTKYYRATGNYDDAENHIEHGFEKITDTTKPLTETELVLEKARLHAAQGKRKTARKKCEEAKEIAEEHGIPVLVEEAETLLKEVESKK